MRFVIVVMDIFDVLRQSLQKQLRIVFNENHIAGIGQPPADGKNRLRQLIHGGFLHPQRDSAMSCFLQQRLAELLGLVIVKSQARASLNMTVLVRLVILYRASFSFARGAGKNSLTPPGGQEPPALLLGTLAQLVSTWYFDMITAFIPK